MMNMGTELGCDLHIAIMVGVIYNMTGSNTTMIENNTDIHANTSSKQVAISRLHNMADSVIMINFCVSAFMVLLFS